MSEMYAHEWEILKGERIPRWPSKIGELRPINVDITSWLGISPGASHYYVEVREKFNMWWCEDENCWVELSCDSGNKGYSMKADVFTLSEAVNMAINFIKLIHGKDYKKQHVVWSGPGRPRWTI